jgi:molybdate transport system permease protein
MDWSQQMDPESVWVPLSISLRVAGFATLIALLIGVSIATLLANWRHPLNPLLDTLFNLPLVLPPTVLGYYLLVLWGAESPLGAWLQRIGLPLVFTWRGAVLAASLVALPLVVQSSRAALEGVDPNLQDVARTLGRSEVSIFFSVSLPLARRGIIAGGILALARALGEFGATLMVAGSIPGRTQTMPIAIYDAVQGGEQARANVLAFALTVTAVALLLLIRHVSTRIGQKEHDG